MLLTFVRQPAKGSNVLLGDSSTAQNGRFLKLLQCLLSIQHLQRTQPFRPTQLFQGSVRHRLSCDDLFHFQHPGGGTLFNAYKRHVKSF
jgi:hypothetical protein